MKIIKHEELKENEPGLLIKIRGGENDGLEFRMVTVHMDDSSTYNMWICNAKEGYFKQVFVPWDFENPNFVEW